MEVLSFDIEGKFAHFRKYYANNTAFTFGIPPRTTVMGIIAAVMGLKKDCYYEDLKSEDIRIGISILSPTKKSFHRLNFLKINSDSDYRGRQKHIQTPLEVISGINEQKDMVQYRIYLSATNNNNGTYSKIKSVLQSGKFHFNPSLGTANFSARIYKVKTWNNVEYINVVDKTISLSSAGLSDSISEIFFDKTDNYRQDMIEEDLMPADFKANHNREVIKMNRVLFTTGGNTLNVKMTGRVYVLNDSDKKLFIQFLE